MKKSINQLLEKIHFNGDGKIEGGFTSVRGGFALKNIVLNRQSCVNTNCGENYSNSSYCTNKANCTGSTNSSNCSNSGTC